MYFILALIALIVLIITRIYYIIYEQFWPKKPKIDDKLIEAKLKYKVRKVDINFGSKLYQTFRQSDNRFQDYLPNLYSKTPLNGIDYCVHYIDTNAVDSDGQTDEEVAKSGADRPLLVLLHGSPGCILDFEEFCSQFGHKYRLIIPQFPGFDFSRKSGYFFQSNEERVEFVVSFLNQLSITEVDCLVCHSGGNPIALQIISGEFEGKLEVKSLVMITPPGFKWLSAGELTNARGLCRIASSCWRRWLYLFLMPEWLQILCGVPETLVRNCTRDELFGMTFVVSMSGFEINIKHRYELLARKRLPTLFVMAGKDGIFKEWKFRKTLEFMGADRDELFINVDSNGESEAQPTLPDWIRVLNFPFGGHFCFIKYSKVFHKHFQQFFDSIQSQN